MKYKSQPRYGAALLIFWCLINWASAASITEETPTEEPAGVESTTNNPQIGYVYPSPCYVEKSKVAELMIRMNHTVQLFNPKDEYLKCTENHTVVEVDPDIGSCTDERISRIQKDLVEVTGSLLRLATRLKNPSWEEVNELDLKKFHLMDDLKVLRVYYGPFPCHSSTIVLHPFAPLIEYFQWNLEQVIALFNEPRMTRPPTTTTPATLTTSTTSMSTVEDMLDTEKSFLELTEMAQLNPSAMSRAVSKIVSQRYNGRVSTFDKLLTFVQYLPTAESKIFGLSAIYDRMHLYNQNHETSKLTKLAASVKRLNDLEAAAATIIDAVARSKLNDLLNDPSLRLMITCSMSYPELTMLAASNSTAMLEVLPALVSLRYAGKASSLDAILAFIDGLPTKETKIFGLSAVYAEMTKGSLEVPQLVKLAKRAMRTGIHENPPPIQNFASSTAWSKFRNLIPNLRPLELIGEKAECNVTNVAYGTGLTRRDSGYPDSTYLFNDQSSKTPFKIYPVVRENKLVFRVQQRDFPLFAYDTNSNTYSSDKIHQTTASERYVLRDNPVQLPADAEINWKLVPARYNQFRILSAKFEDFMFAHKSATGSSDNWRRVLLGRKSASNHDHIPEADLWKLDCRPGSFDIPDELEVM